MQPVQRLPAGGIADDLQSPGPLLALYAVACVGLEWASQASLPDAVLWRPGAGLSIFVLLAGGLRSWPVVFVAMVALEALAAADMPAGLLHAALATGAYAAIARQLGGLPRLGSLPQLGRFAYAVAPAILALAATTVSVEIWNGRQPADDLAAAILRRWLAEVNGILVLVPALLAFSEPAPGERASRGQLVEATAQAAVIGAALWLVFAIADRYGVRFFSLLFLPLVWVAARWGLRGTALALIAIQLGLLLAMQITPHDPAKHFQLQFLTFALCTTGVALGVFVTQRREAELRLQEKQAALSQAMQLATAGEMTSALAHELNQPIAALVRYLGACEVLAVDPQRDAPLLRETVRKAAAEARRASEVIRRLRDFYRTGAVAVAHAQPLSLVDAAVRSVRARAQRAGVRIEVEPAGTLPAVAVDALQLETVLQNLLQNAVEALAQAPEPRVIRVAATAQGAAVTIGVHDSGPGIAAEVAERLFEPFNTTKAQGMGMGLAISRSLIRANGGDLVLDDRARDGARFVVTVPVAAAAPAGGAA